MVIYVSNYTDYNFTRMYLLVILEIDYPFEWVGPVTLYLSFKTKSRYVPQITFYSCLLKFCTVYKRTYIPVKLDRLFYIYRDVNINKKKHYGTRRYTISDSLSSYGFFRRRVSKLIIMLFLI